MTNFDIKKEVVALSVMEEAKAYMEKILPHYAGVLDDRTVIVLDIKDTDAYDPNASVVALAGRTQTSMLSFGVPSYTIAVSHLIEVYSKYDAMLILAHELAHIAQLVTGRMQIKVDVEAKTINKYWMGQRLLSITEADKANTKSVNRVMLKEMTLPWEVEAQQIHNPNNATFGLNMRLAWKQVKFAFKTEYDKARSGGISFNIPSRSFVMDIEQK